MDESSITLDRDELAGLAALISIAEPGSPEAGCDPATLARRLLRASVDGRLEAVGLEWAPSPEAVADARRREDARRSGLLASMRSNRQLVAGIAALVAAFLAVALIGGYGFGWDWTGFPGNKQLWNWLELLVLPLALATLPIWISRSSYLGRRRHVTFVAVIVACAVFVIIGYETPLGWTGFQGNRLWDWLTLLLFPVAFVAAQAWTVSRRAVRSWHWGLLITLVALWALTIVGGYAWNWTWTGYQGNTLWDWIQLTLAPLIVPTLLVPSLLTLATGDAETRARRDRERAYGLEVG